MQTETKVIVQQTRQKAKQIIQRHGMSVMILAAGRGRRMGALTDNIPKPLVEVNEKALIEYQIESLVAAGVEHIVINVAYLADLIVQKIGFGERWGIKINYLYEPLDAYDTGGGIVRALPWLSDPFIVANADVLSEFNFGKLISHTQKMTTLAHIMLVENPTHNLKGDFGLDEMGKLSNTSLIENYTYTGISSYRKALFDEVKVGSKVSLPNIWQAAIAKREVSGEVLQTRWHDVGTPGRWHEVNNQVEMAL